MHENLYGMPAEPGNSDRKTLLGQTLRQRIINMDLAPGASLDEVAIAHEFGLSRPPVRELIRQLAAEGYLELEANRPPRVSPMNYESMRSLFQSAPLIYAATTQLATTCATSADIARLKSIQAQFRQAIEDGNTTARVHYNSQFHYAIGEIARNAYLIPSLLRVLIDHSRLAKTFYRTPLHAKVPEDMQRDMQLAVTQHEQMIDAIAQRDMETTKKLVQEHWELSRKRIAEYVIPSALDIDLDGTASTSPGVHAELKQYKPARVSKAPPNSVEDTLAFKTEVVQ